MDPQTSATEYRILEQYDLFGTMARRRKFDVDTAPEVDAAVAGGAPVFIAVSGGRDSQALAHRTVAHLDAVGHSGPRYLIHSDLGRVEWSQSLKVCQRLASLLHLELIVVRRQAGDMMDRWLSRWVSNVARYAALSCVKLILPWSTPATRFCTSELKSAVISREMRRRHPRGDVVSAVGIRRQESNSRARKPIWAPDARTTRRSAAGHTWHPIASWSVEDVMEYIELQGDELHEAYMRFGSSRVSCVFCIMASIADLQAATTCPENVAIYLEMVALEIRSTFSFQAGRWLGDVAPHLLDQKMREALAAAKERAQAREAAEAELPDELLYVNGWPTFIPSNAQARLIACVRRQVADAVGLHIQFTDALAVQDRYAQLLAEAAARAKLRRQRR